MSWDYFLHLSINNNNNFMILVLGQNIYIIIDNITMSK